MRWVGTILARIFLAASMSLTNSNTALAQEKSESAFTLAQLEELLDKATALNEKYLTLFRDLTAEEKRAFELYDQKTGKIKDQRQFEVKARHESVPNNHDQ
jgi:site-specific DNA-adenine methylase